MDFGAISMKKRRYYKILVASTLFLLFVSMMPQAFASVVEKPGAVQLAPNTQVKINGPVSTYPTDTIDRAAWVGNQYFLDVTGEGGNQIHAIVEFFYFMSSPSKGADFYVVRIMSKTTPKPNDGNWKLDSSGIDDSNGPANKVYAKVTTGAIRWDWCVPWVTLNYEVDRVVDVEETYSTSSSFEAKAQIFIPEAATQLGIVGTIDNSYKITNRYTVTLYKWTIQPYGGSVDFQWKLGLNTGRGDRSEAIGEYLLVITVDPKKTIHIDNFQFEGHLWHWCWPGWCDMVEHLWAKVQNIDINYYAGAQNDAGKGVDAGNTFSSATYISPGSYTGTLYQLWGDTNDWYQFYSSSGQKIYVTMTPPAGADFDLQLYNPSGTLKAGSYYGSGFTDSFTYYADSSGYWRILIYIYTGEGQYSFYVSVTTPGGGGGGGCPILHVYDGDEYVSEGLLDIHNPDGVDVVTDHTLITTPEEVQAAYLLRLTEHPKTISHIDQVKLFAILQDKTLKELQLISAYHSEYGNVLPKLLFSDEIKAETLGADHNNGVSQSIDLKFKTPAPNIEIVGFIFEIEGNNALIK